MLLWSLVVSAAAILTTAVPAQQPSSPAAQEPPKFKAGVAVVPIAVVVRDGRGGVVPGLTQADFEVLENGKPRPIVEFRASENGPVRLAVLFDTSSSMRDAHHAQGKAVVAAVTSALKMNGDEAALFTFDQSLRQETPFTGDAQVIRDAAARTVAWGQTSLYDAVAETAKKVAEGPAPRQAVVVITDGVDTSSNRTPSDVSRFASSVDVPVYIIGVAKRRGGSGLDDLATATGGDLVDASTSERAAAGIAALVAELRQQYFLAIDSANAPGWYRLQVRNRKGGLNLRARSGYVASAH